MRLIPQAKISKRIKQLLSDYPYHAEAQQTYFACKTRYNKQLKRTADHEAKQPHRTHVNDRSERSGDKNASGMNEESVRRASEQSEHRIPNAPTDRTGKRRHYYRLDTFIRAIIYQDLKSQTTTTE